MSKRLWNARQYLMEIKLGMFFLIGMIFFFVAVVSIKEATFLKRTHMIKVRFNFAEGLRAASPVRFCGVDVGDVAKVEIVNRVGERSYVLVNARVNSDIKVPRNSYYFVNSLSLFGEKYLEITPPPQNTNDYISDNEIVEGLSPIPLFNTFANFDKTMDDVSRFVREGELKSALEGTLVNLRDATSSLKGILGDMRDSKGTVGRLLGDDRLYRDLDEFVVDLKLHPWKLLYKPKDFKSPKTRNAGQTIAFKTPRTPIQKPVAVEM